MSSRLDFIKDKALARSSSLVGLCGAQARTQCMQESLSAYFSDASNDFDWQKYKPRVLKIDGPPIGGDHQIVVQSMALSGPARLEVCKKETLDLLKAGSEYVRIALNSDESAKNISKVQEYVVQRGYNPSCLIACGQYEVHRLLQQYPECINAFGKIRINPGNVGFGNKYDSHFDSVIEVCAKYEKPVRIGGNWGSLDKYVMAEILDRNNQLKNPKPLLDIQIEALVRSAIYSANRAEEIGLSPDQIVISCKVSDPDALERVYVALSVNCDYPLHVGLTEAGPGLKGITSTIVGLTKVLDKGIGSTIRCSLTPRPGEPRAKEVELCYQVLQSLGLRHSVPQITACPGCGRTSDERFQALAAEMEDYVKTMMPIWKKDGRAGVEKMSIAVMGCVVNGPGESKHANIGISLPGDGEAPIAAVFEDGRKTRTLKGDDIDQQFKLLVEQYVMLHF